MKDKKSGRYDAVTLELMWTRLISMTDEAAVALVRTSFSTNVRESNDFACVITDADGNSLAQATHSIPSFLNTVPRTIRHFLQEYPPETLRPNDVLITNDIWLGTGHLPDITVAKPVFLDGKLVAWAGSVAHAPDIGGRIRSADARVVYEEGLQIPIMKALEAGVMDRTFERILRQNVRVPEQVLGDLYAQFTALDLIEARLLGMMAEQGLQDLVHLAADIHTRSEAAMREAISVLPDGVYRETAITDGLAKPIRLEMALTVKGSDISVDFAGSDEQVAASINVCLAYTTAYTSYGIRTVLLPNVPGNEGVLAPISVTAPPGSILNSVPPAAGGARALVGHLLPMMAVRALAQALPERGIATVGSPLWCVNLSGERSDRTTFANMFFMNGGYGGSRHRDGINVLSWPSNISSTPIEVIEQLSPIRVNYRRLRTGTGGDGEHRGGTGQEMRFESRSQKPFVVSFMAERTRDEAAAAGLLGGSAGAPGAVLVNGAPVNPKVQHVIEPDGTVELRTPGGGGYGDPARRAQQARDADRANGYTRA